MRHVCFLTICQGYGVVFKSAQSAGLTEGGNKQHFTSLKAYLSNIR